MATFVNDLRLTELATGEGSGTWGTTTNTNLELVAEAFSFGTEAITTNADTHTTTIADGATDPGRSIFLKYTGTLDSACTITIGPNTVSKLWFIENATSGSQSIIVSQGSGANITIPNGQTKAIYSDGAGSGAAMVDAFQDLSVPDLFVDDDLTIGDDLVFSSDSAVITFGADGDTTLTHTDGSGLTLNSTNKLMFNDASQFIQGSSATVLSLGATDEIDLTATAIDVNGTIDVSGNATLGGTLGVTGAVTANAGISIDNITIDGTEIDLSSGDLTIDVAGDIIFDADGGDFRFKDAGTQQFILDLDDSANSVILRSSTSDGDMIFQGNDGGSNITALTLDMSAAGAATFNSSVTSQAIIASNASGVPSQINGAANNNTLQIFADTTSNQSFGLLVDAGTSSSDYTAEFRKADNTTIMRIRGDGKVGIGTNSPDAEADALHVVSSGTNTVQIDGTGSHELYSYHDSGGAGWANGADSSYGELLYLNESDSLVQIYASGLRTADFGSGAIILNEGSRDQDFRVESDSNANALIVDAGLSHVGINRAANSVVGLTVNSTQTSSSYYAFEASNASSESRFVVRSDGQSDFFDGNNANTLRIGIAGGETIVNEGSTDRDFRVESNADANAFFVNGGDGVVSFGGMGTNTRSPSGVQPKFQANSLTRMDSSISLCCNSNDALASLLMFSKTRSGNLTGATAAQAGDAVGAITWNAADGTDIEHGIAAIDAVVETGIGTNDTPGAIRFYTNSGTTAASEKMKLGADGSLTLGNSSYGSSLGQLRIINDANATAPASLSLFGFGNVADGGEFAKIEFCMQISGTGGNVVAKIEGEAKGTNENAADLVFQTATGGSLAERMRIDSNGVVTKRLSASGTGMPGNSVTLADTTTVNGLGGTHNAAGLILISADSGNSRSISAAGTINASGADYAEYMTKADGCGTIAKGDVVGVDVNGKLTDVFADAISFVIKSTDPSYVGGDNWMTPEQSDPDSSEYINPLSDEYNALRASQDRIAFSGQVPVNITGSFNVGDYVYPEADGSGIKAVAKSSPTFEEYQLCVGKIWATEEDGRPFVAVKIG